MASGYPTNDMGFRFQVYMLELGLRQQQYSVGETRMMWKQIYIQRHEEAETQRRHNNPWQTPSLSSFGYSVNVFIISRYKQMKRPSQECERQS